MDAEEMSFAATVVLVLVPAMLAALALVMKWLVVAIRLKETGDRPAGVRGSLNRASLAQGQSRRQRALHDCLNGPEAFGGYGGGFCDGGDGGD